MADTGDNQAAQGETARLASAGESLLRRVPIEITVVIGKARPTVRELVALRRNSVLQLDSRIDDPVEIYVGDRLIARGELLELAEEEGSGLAVRLTEIAGTDEAN